MAQQLETIIKTATIAAIMAVSHIVSAFETCAREVPTGTITTADTESVRGQVGFFVLNAEDGKYFGQNKEKLFPMQSVCKLPVSIAILRLADLGKLSPQDKLTVTKADIGPYHSPIKELINKGQTEFTIRDLITRAICESDNTACDVLIEKAGGAQMVTKLLRDCGVKGVRIDRPEKQLQPDSLKIDKYVVDPRDSSSPADMVDLLKKLNEGKLLSATSTKLVLEDLFNTRTGPNRLTAGLAPGWKLGHKTGTGQDVDGKNAGTNDVGILVGPTGETIYIAVFTIGSRSPIEARERLMAKLATQAIAGRSAPKN